jgi:hypothetical protein
MAASKRKPTPQAFVCLELNANGSQPERLFSAHISPNGFRIGDSQDEVGADEVAYQLRWLCLDAKYEDGSEHQGILDLYDALPERFPQALKGHARWSFNIAGRSRNVGLIRENQNRVLETLIEVERGLVRLLNGEVGAPTHASSRETLRTLFDV